MSSFVHARKKLDLEWNYNIDVLNDFIFLAMKCFSSLDGCLEDRNEFL